MLEISDAKTAKNFLSNFSQTDKKLWGCHSRGWAWSPVNPLRDRALHSHGPAAAQGIPKPT